MEYVVNEANQSEKNVNILTSIKQTVSFRFIDFLSILSYLWPNLITLHLYARYFVIIVCFFYILTYVWIDRLSFSSLLLFQLYMRLYKWMLLLYFVSLFQL